MSRREEEEAERRAGMERGTGSELAQNGQSRVGRRAEVAAAGQRTSTDVDSGESGEAKKEGSTSGRTEGKVDSAQRQLEKALLFLLVVSVFYPCPTLPQLPAILSRRCNEAERPAAVKAEWRKTPFGRLSRLAR